MKRYNNVLFDGSSMKLEILGGNMKDAFFASSGLIPLRMSCYLICPFSTYERKLKFVTLYMPLIIENNELEAGEAD
ncbi:hypothetical protein YC2023_041471 [Brassica napus]